VGDSTGPSASGESTVSSGAIVPLASYSMEVNGYE
jgi:hypothetical protein